MTRRMVAGLIVALTMTVYGLGASSARAATSVQASGQPHTVLQWGALSGKAGSVQVHVGLTMPNIVQVATSAEDTYLLNSSGQVYAFGLGEGGGLGDGSNADSLTTPVLVNLPVPIALLANPAPHKSEIAVGTDGSVWGWGLNQYDSLCVTQQDIQTPVQLPLSNVTAVTGQGAHALYVVGGTLYECGKGAGGALGDGSNADSSTPVQVNLPGPVSAVQSSWQGSGAVVNGTYYDWGFNQSGQLGNGTTTNSNVPVQVNLPAPVAQVFQGGASAGDGTTMALLTTGDVYAWGVNTAGEFDTGTFTNSAVPVKVPALKGASEVACGGTTCYAIVNGHLQGFGWNGEDEFRKVGAAVTYMTSTGSNEAALK